MAKFYNLEFSEYYNIPEKEEKLVEKWNEDLSKIKKIIEFTTNSLLYTSSFLQEVLNFSQEILVDIDNYTLSIQDMVFPINIWDKNFKWEYRVVEKIKYPFYRWKKYFHYPSEENILWKYLIILMDEKTWKKIPQWIHTYIKNWENDSFFQGYKKWGGCIRMSEEDLDKVFKLISLWAKLIIK